MTREQLEVLEKYIKAVIIAEQPRSDCQDMIHLFELQASMLVAFPEKATSDL